MQTISTHKCFGGTLGYFKHTSISTACDMRFTAFVPPQAAADQKQRALIFLSGLTCTEENFTAKAGAYRVAAELGLIVIAPDTSPRGEGVPAGEGGDLGFGAGFYVDATNNPWSAHYRMETYIADELVQLVTNHFPIQSVGLCGHSMGGHGALTLFQKHPGKFRSLSAFAPICAASQSPWSQKAFTNYFGDDTDGWKQHDACELLMKMGPVSAPILIDQGMSDPFLQRLQPELFEAAAAKVGQKLTLRRHEGYDHGYFFVQSFIEDHLRHHAA
jgi:S-formylglutathione hydrolase